MNKSSKSKSRQNCVCFLVAKDLFVRVLVLYLSIINTKCYIAHIVKINAFRVTLINSTIKTMNAEKCNFYSKCEMR